MINSIKNLSTGKKVLLIAIVTIAIVTGIGVYAYSKLNNEELKTITTSAKVSSGKLAMQEEKIDEVREQIIVVKQDNIIDENEEEKESDETVKVGEKEVKVPKSKVAPTNSAEDSEKNKKTGGETVSQDQANQMFENVGTKSFGIDVSAHQGNINWAQVKAAGVDFAMIRVGFRGQSVGQIYEDNKFKSNVAGATANGIKVGIYFYSTAVNETEALEEAIWVTRKISTYRITYPVVYDFEDFGASRCANVGGAQATSNAITFLNFVKSAGYDPMMYANKNDITTKMNRASFQNYKFWLAHYTKQTDYSGLKHMWQYTSKGSVPGISGNVDMDIAYFSYGSTAAPKHTHNFNTLMKEVKPTCTEDGSKLMECSCGETETQVIPKLGHKFESWSTITKATQETEGLQERICTTCKHKETRPIEKLKPTETNTNNISNNTNTNVNNNTSVEHTHNFVEVSKTDATCTEEGLITKKCTVCEKIITEPINALEHDFVGEKCAICGALNPNYTVSEEN